MTDQEKREKVIKGLKCCTKKVCIYKDTEKECPYSELCGEYEDSFEDCTTALSKDAIALLKEQEPIKPTRYQEGRWFKTWRCGACGGTLVFRNGEDKPNYCTDCGRAVKWE